MGKFKKVAIVLLVLAMVMALLPTVALAKKGGNGNGQGGDNGVSAQAPPGQAKKADPQARVVRHKETGNGPYGGEVDPCEVRGDCGNGDHGQGDPEDKGQGSAHANCNASQGEVDPWCPAEPRVPAEPPTPPALPVLPTHPQPPEPPAPSWSRQVCFISPGVVEFFEAAHDYDERFVLGESWDMHCEWLSGGVYTIRPWNSTWGHGPDAPRYVVEVTGPGPRVVIHNPMAVGEVLDFGGVVVLRMSNAQAVPMRPL